MKKVALAAAIALVAGQAGADSLRFNEIPMTGSPTGGYHIIDIGGAKCKLKSSEMVGGRAAQGCNYIITNPGIETGGLMVKGPWRIQPMQSNGCSTSCEP